MTDSTPTAPSPPLTHSQKMSQQAFLRIKARHAQLQGKAREDYCNFAKKFPSLIQSCGPLQAVAFALSSSQEHSVRADVADDWAALTPADGRAETAQELMNRFHSAGLAQYLQLTRRSLEAASWLKRYAEAVFEISNSTEPDAATGSPVRDILPSQPPRHQARPEPRTQS